jgi:hypothetical protein
VSGQVEEDESRRQKDRDSLLSKAEEMEEIPSDEEADQLIEKLMAEAKLEETLGGLPDVDMDDGSEKVDVG